MDKGNESKNISNEKSLVNECSEKSRAVLRDIINSGKRFNKHIELPDLYLAAYIRKTERYCSFPNIRKIVETLEIGTVQVDENERRKGNFKKFLAHFESLAKSNNRMVFIECVHNTFLAKFLERNGYIEDKLNPKCFWKDPSVNHQITSSLQDSL